VLVDLIQSAREEADAIIINPAGHSFISVAMLDALKAFEGPIFEVHVSNIHARDELHRHSKLSSAQSRYRWPRTVRLYRDAGCTPRGRQIAEKPVRAYPPGFPGEVVGWQRNPSFAR
jgi:Dehydroquinase class II